jgi:biopolymer transport protein ExbD
VGPGLAIPKRGNLYDYQALTECAARLKGSAPDFAAETQAYISANPDTDYQTVVSVLDSLRMGPSGEPLFPDVNFRAAK